MLSASRAAASLRAQLLSPCDALSQLTQDGVLIAGVVLEVWS